jgi:hypothetical protein
MGLTPAALLEGYPHLVRVRLSRLPLVVQGAQHLGGEQPHQRGTAGP